MHDDSAAQTSRVAVTDLLRPRSVRRLATTMRAVLSANTCRQVAERRRDGQTWRPGVPVVLGRCRRPPQAQRDIAL